VDNEWKFAVDLWQSAHFAKCANARSSNVSLPLPGGGLGFRMGTRAAKKKTKCDPAEIVLIDQAPLRRSVAAECTETMARLDEVRTCWHRFDREDRPAFIRWRAREFGALLSEARDIEDRIRDAQNLVHQVEMEMRRHFQDPHSAYMRVMFRRENPTAEPEPESTETQPGRSGPARKLSEFDKEALFQEWVQKFMGTSPDKLDDHVYSTTFEVFKSHMFTGAAEEFYSGATKAARPPPSQSAKNYNGAEAVEEEVEESDIDARVKELYRTLVRRLHPDLRADGSADVSSLWHEVQEAYDASDIAQMEILLALCDIQASEMGEGTSFSQMQAVLAELKRSLRALEKMLLEAEGEDAWNFARSGPNDDLRSRVERELKLNLETRKQRLDLFTKTIADWAQERPVRRASGRR